MLTVTMTAKSYELHTKSAYQGLSRILEEVLKRPLVKLSMDFLAFPLLCQSVMIIISSQD